MHVVGYLYEDYHNALSLEHKVSTRLSDDYKETCKYW